MSLGSHNSLHSHLQQPNPQHAHGGGGVAAAVAGAAGAGAQRSASVADIDMVGADSASGAGGAGGGGGAASASDGVLAPIALQSEEPAYTRKKVADFLAHHTAYELIPESGKVVLLDVDLPVRQAFHALHEQGEAGALCLWPVVQPGVGCLLL